MSAVPLKWSTTYVREIIARILGKEYHLSEVPLKWEMTVPQLDSRDLRTENERIEKLPKLKKVV